MSKTNIYILRLENSKYYIGKSKDVMDRYQQHLDGEGSTWTKKYRPLALLKVIENVSPFEEDKYTKEYMAKYGIDNVRGGTYASEKLDQIQYDSLQKEIWGAQDSCLYCGKKGHFASECYMAKKHSQTNACYRCGRSTHFVAECYARTTIDGEILDSESDEDD
jgi:cellular nucleic acid-binding protein